MRRVFLAILASLFLSFLASLPAHAQEAASPALFGSTEIRSGNLVSFTNWTGVMNRFDQNNSLGQGMCASASGNQRDHGGDCVWDKWQAQLRTFQGKSEIEQLRAVNREMNRRRYILDRVNWGMEDYWATVFEFLRKNGDCEDYAISKYVTLRALGWPADRLRIVILRDTKLDLNHAVLAAYTSQGIYIGDNQISDIVKADAIRHYKPIYSINEQNWWLHRVRQ